MRFGIVILLLFSFSISSDIRPPFRLSSPSVDAQYFTNEGFRASFVGSRKIARDLFYRACLLGDDLGCLAFNEIKMPLKIKDNFNNYEACNFGDAISCFRLYEYYISENIPDRFSANWYLAKSCRLGNAIACKIEISKFKALVISKRQLLNNKCNLKNARACFELANMYLSGNGVQKNFIFARELIAKSCNLGLKQACMEYIKILSIN